MKYLMLLCLPLWLLALPRYLADIPLPKTEVINISLTNCEEGCLLELLNEGKAFSLMALYDPSIDNPDIKYQTDIVKKNLGITWIPADSDYEDGTVFRLAVMLPKKNIGRYAVSTTQSILSYLLTRNHKFSVEVFDTIDETPESLAGSVQEINDKGYTYVIALLTSTGARNLKIKNPEMQIYIPTINQTDVQDPQPQLYFGGIDYRAQIDKLMFYGSDKEKISVFYDDSDVGRQLNTYVAEGEHEIGFMQPIKSNRKYAFKNLITKNKDHLENAAIFLNTPIVKSSLLMSQLTYYKIEDHTLLSTQINYSPVLLSLTQTRDRERMFIANSISHTNDLLDENNQLMGSNIRYDWINYSVSLGTEYFYLQIFSYEPRFFQEPMENNQVQYSISIMAPYRDRFISTLE